MKIPEKRTEGSLRRRPVVASESRQIRSLIQILEETISEGPTIDDRERIQFVIDKLNQMGSLAAAGLHANPGVLAIYGNPGKVGENTELTVTMRKILGFVEQVRYERTRDPQGFFFHDFGPADSIWAAELVDGQKIVVIANVKGRPLWGHQ